MFILNKNLLEEPLDNGDLLILNQEDYIVHILNASAKQFYNFCKIYSVDDAKDFFIKHYSSEQSADQLSQDADIALKLLIDKSILIAAELEIA